MIVKIGYNVHNGGDGSAYPNFFESKRLAEIDEAIEILLYDEGWAESSIGTIALESDTTIRFKRDVNSAEDVKKSIESHLEDYEDDLDKYKKLTEFLIEINSILSGG